MISDGTLDDNKLDELDPDNDNFVLTIEDAEALNKNMNLLTFIRKNILASNAKLFISAISSIKASTLPGILHRNWEPEVHDKELLYSVINKGFTSLSSLANSSEFSHMKLNSDDLAARLNFLCEFFKDFTSSTKTKKKKELITMQNELLNNQINSSGMINLSQISKKKNTKTVSNMLLIIRT